MVIFGLFAGGSFNKGKCPFCGKELDFGSSKCDEGKLISAAREEKVLRVNSFGELALGTRKYEEKRERGTHYQNLICPKHKYEITRVERYLEKQGKGFLDEGGYYKITRWDYEYVSAGKLNERQVKLLKRCCQNASKDLYKVFNSYD